MSNMDERRPLTMEVQLRDGVSLQEVLSIQKQIEEFFSMRALTYEEKEFTFEELSSELLSMVVSIRMSDLLDKSKIESRRALFWWEIVPRFCFFKLDTSGPKEEVDEDENVSFFQEWSLPCVEFHQIWQNLYYDDDLKIRLLQYVETALLFSCKGVNPEIISWNRVVLLHGPPGTGKTSLCKALAQKLAIRLYSKFTEGIKFMEVNAHSLFSKYFSESGKLVSSLFEKIQDLVQCSTILLFILIDEVESLTAARKTAASGSEPSDALRAVNSFLTQIDRLRRFPNVVLLTTSNLTQAIDLAFLDRADIKAFVGPPSLPIRQKILEKCLHELQRIGMVQSKQEAETHSHSTFDIISSMQTDLKFQETSPFDLLYACSRISEGLSCRSLKKLPFLACVSLTVTHSTPFMCQDFLQALKESILTSNQDRSMIQQEQ